MGGGAAPTDFYVCGNCPFANDMNPGTQAQPVQSISAGIALARPTQARVFVSSSYNTAIHTYSEDVTFTNGVTLQGRWAVISGVAGITWTRNAARTRLRNTTATGVKFPAGVGATTVLEGFNVDRANPGIGGNGRWAGITITQSGPTLRDFDVGLPTVAVGNPTEAIGIDVSGTATALATPTFSGNPSGGTSTVAAGPGQTSSIGLAAIFARVTVSGVDFTAGSANTLSEGVGLVNGVGSSFQRGTYAAGAAPACVGFASSGDASGVRVEGITATGCPQVPNLLNPPTFGVGVLFDHCPPNGVGGVPAIVRDVTASGGIVGGRNSTAIGGAALDGCAVRFEGSQPSSSTFIGATSAPFGSDPDAAWGIACSFAGFQNSMGFDSPCSLNNVTATGGNVAATATSAGLVCDGTCANQSVTCRGSCGEVSQSVISAGAGVSMAHVYIRNSSPALRQNRIGLTANPVACGTNAAVTGLTLEGAGGSYVNNLVLAGKCLRTVGAAVELRMRNDGPTNPTFNSNTIISYANTSGGNTPLGSVGVQLGAQATSTVQIIGGTFRNNIIHAGPVQGTGAVLAAFSERVANADPAELANNLLNAQANGTPQPPLYVNEGNQTIGLISVVNMLTGASGNIAGDPQFVNTGNSNFSLSTNSPARGAGHPMGAPMIDLLGATRPNPSNTPPDIGCFEVP